MPFTVLNGEKKVGINTDAIVFVNKAAEKPTYLIQLFLGSFACIELVYNDMEKRNADFDTLLNDIASNKVKPKYNLGFSSYDRPENLVKVEGNRYHAIEITNSHNNAGESLSLNINTPNPVKVRGTTVNAVEITNGFSSVGDKMSLQVTRT